MLSLWMLFAEAWPLLGDADATSTISDYAPAMSTSGTLVISAWHVYYTTAVLIPKMHEDHGKERNQILERFDKQMDDQRTEFAKMLQDQRSDFSSAVQSLLGELKEARLHLAQGGRRGS